jgi:hypothetical protein
MKRTWLTALAVGVAGCGPAPGPGAPDSGLLAHAAARQTCAPWDGPAVSIVLAVDSLAAETPSPPYVEFRIYRSVELLSGRTVRFSGTSSDSGSVVNCGADGPCEFTDGEIDFGAVRVPDDLTGRYRVLMAGKWVTGAYRARWLDRRELCG